MAGRVLQFPEANEYNYIFLAPVFGDVAGPYLPAGRFLCGFVWQWTAPHPFLPQTGFTELSESELDAVLTTLDLEGDSYPSMVLDYKATGLGPTRSQRAVKELQQRHLIEVLRLIRFRGHLPKGGYDVQTDGRYAHAPAAPAIR